MSHPKFILVIWTSKTKESDMFDHNTAYLGRVLRDCRSLKDFQVFFLTLSDFLSVYSN